jgi:hypothetical protein
MPRREGEMVEQGAELFNHGENVAMFACTSSSAVAANDKVSLGNLNCGDNASLTLDSSAHRQTP